MNVFIAKNKIVSVTHLPILMTLQANMFIASDERILCWGRTLLALETNAFHAGNGHFSAGDERIEIVHSSLSHTHAASYQ